MYHKYTTNLLALFLTGNEQQILVTTCSLDSYCFFFNFRSKRKRNTNLPQNCGRKAWPLRYKRYALSTKINQNLYGSICKRCTYIPIKSFSTCKRFWSNFNIVSLVSLATPFGSSSMTFCDKCKSVRFTKPPISLGISSNLKSRNLRYLRSR
jgi:hypothetical protein